LVVGSEFPYPSPDVSFHNIGVIYFSSLGNHASASHVSRDRIRRGAGLWADIVEGKVMPDYYQCFQCGQKYKTALYCPRCGVMTVEKFLGPEEYLVNTSSAPSQPVALPQPTPQPPPTIHYHVEPVHHATPVDVMATEVISEMRWQRFWRGFGCVAVVVAILLGCALLYYFGSAFMSGFNS
jgi:hypothetical protein